MYYYQTQNNGKGTLEMEVIETGIEGVKILVPKIFGDKRGWFYEVYNKETFKELGLDYDFIQDNESFNLQKGTLRGLHFQRGEASQAKLVRCIKGIVMDVAVDLRKSSPTFGKWTKAILSAETKHQLLIPRGFAHGYVTMTPGAQFAYKVDNKYSPKDERFLRWNDPDIGIDWGILDPIINDRDANAPLFSEITEDLFD